MDWTAFEEYVEKVMKDCHIVGVAVSVAGPKEVLYAKGFGVKNLDTAEPVTPNTIFGCASVSKSFTSMALAQLADKGLLSVDDPVVEHIPPFRLNGFDVAKMKEVKVRHILSHTTGLPPMTRNQDITDFDRHIKYLATADYELLGKPGEYFSYCNDTFLLNGFIIQDKTNQLYRRYMTRHILDAVGMHRSTYNLEELPKMGDLSTPYIYNKKTGKHEEQPWPVLGTYEVGGGVRSCVLDLAKYGQVYLGGGVASNGERIVSDSGLWRMWNTPMYPSTRKGSYNLALVVTPDYDGRGITLVEHSGGQPGVSSNFGFVPEKGITVSVLTNVTGVPAAAIWLAAVNTALGIPLETQKSVETVWEPSQWPPSEVGIAATAAAAGRAATTANDEKAAIAATEGPSAKTRVPGGPTSYPASFELHLARLCGNYKSAEGGDVTIETKHPAIQNDSRTKIGDAGPGSSATDSVIGREGAGHFTVTTDGESYAAHISDERTLFFVANGVQQVMRFYFDAARDAEHPWAVLAGSRMLRRVGEAG